MLEARALEQTRTRQELQERASPESLERVQKDMEAVPEEQIGQTRGVKQLTMAE